MAEPGGTPIALTVLKGGINRLRVKAGASPSSLYDLLNARLTIDGSVVPREGTIRNATLDDTTAGLVYFDGAFQVFSTVPTTVPAGYVNNLLVNASVSMQVAITDAAPAVFTTVQPHTLLEGAPITLSVVVGGTLPAPFAVLTTYYVTAVNFSPTTFTLSATEGGSPIPSSTAGSGPFAIAAYGTGDTITFIWFSKPFMGFLYVVAEFSSGAIAHFWLQSGGAWAANTVYQANAIVTPVTPNGLAYQAVQDIAPIPTWTPETFIVVDQTMEPTVPNGYYYQATAATTDAHTGEIEPTWPTNIGGTVQEFGDFVTSGLAAAATVATQPLATNITDRYGNSADVAGASTASTTGAVGVLPSISGTLAPWKAGTIYPTGSVVTPTVDQGAVINAIPNGDFEAGNDGNWTFGGSGEAWSISNAGNPYQGHYEAINPPGATSALMTMNTFGVCTPGQTVTVTYYLTTGTSGDSNIAVSAKMNWYSDTGATALISTTDGGAHSSHSAWTKETATFVAPAGAITCRVAMHAASGTASRDTVGVDLITWNLEAPTAITNFIYEAVQVGPGTSAASPEPAWPTIAGDTVDDNTVIWEAVGSSIITWTAAPLTQSGATEPVWPTIIGGSVSDGNMSWVAISRQIEDPNLPVSKVVALGASKVFVGDNDIVAYSATVNPTDYTTANNAGYLPTGLNNYGNNPMEVLCLYRGNLLAINSGGYQMWQIDPDPANMAILDAQPVGSVWTLGAQSIANDALLLTNLGLRNVGTTGATANMATGQLGQPIDVLIQAALAAGTYYPTSLYYPARGQEWTIFGPQAFVLTVNGNSQKSWSRYVFPDAITYWTLKGEVLYLRTAGNLIWQLDAATLVDDYGGTLTPPAGVEVLLPLSTPGYTITDASVNGLVWTSINGAQITTVGGFWAPAVLVLNWYGAEIDAYIQTPSSPGFPLDPGTSDFTWEGWFEMKVYAHDGGGSMTISDFTNSDLQGFRVYWSGDISGGTIAAVGGAFGTDVLHSHVASSQNLVGIALNTWHHFAFVRHGSVFTMYVDGVAGTPLTVSAAALGPALVGQYYAGVDWQSSYQSTEWFGNLAELRWSNSALYTTNFTPVQAPFSIGTVADHSVDFTCVMQWPYLDLTRLGFNKELVGFDLAGTGDVTVQFGWDETDLTSFSDNPGFATSLSVTAPYELTAADTLPGQPIAMPLSAVSYSMILTWAPNQAWSWQASQLYAITTPSAG